MLSINNYAIEHTILKYIKNGFYIPPLFILLCVSLNQIFLPLIICLKLCSVNYYYWFSHMYDFKFSNKNYNILKQMVRFTDTGHIASFIYYFYPNFLPIAFNIHFIITIGYWGGKLCFDLHDFESYRDTDIIIWFTEIWAVLNHGMGLLCLTWFIINDQTCNDYFDNSTITYTYYWIYTWFLLIYLPWRFRTGDVLYSILSNESTTINKISYVLLIHILVIISNTLGYFLQNNECLLHYTI